MNDTEGWPKPKKEVILSIEQEKENNDGLTPEQREMAEYFLPKFNENINLEKEKRDCNQEVIELKNLFEAFETNNSIDKLYSIINLTYKDAPNHPIRESARQDLIPIVTKLNILKEETNITMEKYEELNNHYKYLSKAVGIINGDKVRH